jgi:large subunit ribosomal protein L30
VEKVKLVQVRSAIGREPQTKGTLKALGLGRIGKTSTIVVSDSVKGMINAVKHLISVQGV